MDPITQQAVLATAGAAGAGDPIYVDDVFSTFVYEGTGSTQSLNNGLDLSGEGGLVWLKKRSSTGNHWIFDTERGANSRLLTNTDGAANTGVEGLSFNSNGFTINSDSSINASGAEHVMWSFRKASGFFDVVTYTGNGTAGRTVSHSLGSVPGMIMLKQTSGSSARWFVYHRSTGNGTQLTLNNDNAAFSTSAWNNTTPTSTEFTLNDGSLVNGNGETYVAYLFAHDDQSFGTDSDEAIIKCGSFTSNSSGAFDVNLGYEPQLVLIKKSSGTGDWYMLDVMRGLARTHISTLRPNTSGTDLNYVAEGYGYAHASGFASDTNFFGASQTFIYMAIRRPHKPPEAGTEVFDAAFKTGATLGRPSYRAGFPIDMAIREDQLTGSTFGSHVLSRLTGTKQLFTTSASVESNNSSMVMDYMNGFNSDAFDSTDTIAWMFKRAPGFFDVVSYVGDGSDLQTETHNLKAVPELMIVKSRNYSNRDWAVYSSVTGNSKFIYLHRTDAPLTTSIWRSTTPTSTQFTVGASTTVNASGYKYNAYLFATLDGISKVGSYTGTGGNINVDCGFTAGARFVLIRRTNSSGNWFLWDSTRGIVSGNDPYILLNSTNSQVSSTDYIDPLNAGFTVTSSAIAQLNSSGSTYLFLAIA